MNPSSTGIRNLPPCKDCTERKIEPINCHTICERYKAFTEWNKYCRERRLIAREEDYIVAESICRRRRGKKREY